MPATRLAVTGLTLLVGLSCTGATMAPRPTTEGTLQEEALSEVDTRGVESRSPEPGFDLPEAELGTQRLFRIRYEGPQGEGRLRLVLRLARDDRYSITTADVLGRALWSLSLVDDELVLVDHRAETFCRSDGEVTLPEVALAPLPLRSIPGVLLGYLPVAEGAQTRRDGPDSVEIVDPPNRRWTTRREGGRLRAWTLWLAEVPTLWWTSAADGGILSHRQGVQFRWRQSVAEALAEEPRALTPPDGYLEKSCHEPTVQELRQDQPPPRGSGAAP